MHILNKSFDLLLRSVIHVKNLKILSLGILLLLSKIDARDRTFLKTVIPQDSIGAEIGVWKGEFSSFLLKNLRPKKLHLIDPWLFIKRYPWAMYGGVVAKSQNDMDTIYNMVQRKFCAYPQVIIHRMGSSEASYLFQDSYFDWIYIDGDHTYEGVTADLNNYFPKVKKKGLIIGDDFGWESVRQAVKTFCLIHNIQNYTVSEFHYIIKK